MEPLVVSLLVVALSRAGVPPPTPTTATPPAAETELERELEAVRRLEPDTAPGTARAQPLARRLGAIGLAYLEKGDTGRAIELLEEAYGWDGENGVNLAELTLAHVRAGNFAFARFYLELAEQRAPQAPPRIYATLGEIYYALNRVEDAVLAWELFERLQGNDPRVLRRLSRARQELSFARGQRFLAAGDFLVYSDAAVPPEMSERVAELLAGDYRSESGFLQTRLPAAQAVVLYAGRAYFSLVSIPDWIGGVFDGKIRISVDPDGGMTPALESVLAHELAHALVRQASRDRAPGWLHEGIAQWCSGLRVLRRDFRRSLAGRPVRSLEELDRELSRQTDRASMRSAYVESLGLVEYLVQERGPAAVACIVRDLAEGATVEQALVRETGLTASGLVQSWKRWAGLGSP